MKLAVMLALVLTASVATADVVELKTSTSRTWWTSRPLALRLRRIFAVSFAPLVFAGCFGPLFEHIRIDAASVAELRAQVPTYGDDALRGREYSVLQPVSATSCKNKLYDPSPTAEDATDQLRVKTSRLGGNGLLGVTCEASSGTSLVTNCWSSLTCHGAAIKINK